MTSTNSGPHKPKLHVDEVELMTDETWRATHGEQAEKFEEVRSSDHGSALDDSHDILNLECDNN